MSPRHVLGLGLALAGCAAPVALDAPGHPARLDAPTAAHTVEVAALPPVAAPAVPAVLRPDGRGAGRDPMPMPTVRLGDAAARPTMDHGAMDATSMTSAAPALTGALEAYLAVHDALASDRLDAHAARALARSVSTLTETPPDADPHFWHLRGDAVATLRQAADALTEATDLATARTAFGVLSAPFADAVGALGSPAGLDVVRHTCGMADAPEGGVWLQRDGPVRNPYFGTAMRMCSRRVDEMPAMDHDAMSHDETSHEGHR